MFVCVRACVRVFVCVCVLMRGGVLTKIRFGSYVCTGLACITPALKSPAELVIFLELVFKFANLKVQSCASFFVKVNTIKRDHNMHVDV